MVDKAGTIVVFTDYPICTMNLYQSIFTEATKESRLKGKVKTFLLAMKENLGTNVRDSVNL